MRVELRCAQQFSQGDSKYLPGATVQDDVWQAWQSDTLANRLTGGFVVWVPVQDTPAADGADPSQMTKEQLVEFIALTFSVDVDKRISHSNMLQQLAVLQERARATAAAEATAAAAAAAGTGGSSTPPAP